MTHETMTLKQAARHIHLDENELKHVAQRGEIDASVRGGEWYFDHAALDEWAQRHLLASSERSLAARHRDMFARWRAEHGAAFAVAPECGWTLANSAPKSDLARSIASDSATSTSSQPP